MKKFLVFVLMSVLVFNIGSAAADARSSKGQKNEATKITTVYTDTTAVTTSSIGVSTTNTSTTQPNTVSGTSVQPVSASTTTTVAAPSTVTSPTPTTTSSPTPDAVTSSLATTSDASAPAPAPAPEPAPAPAPAPAVDTTWIDFLNGSASYWYKEMANSTYSGAASNNYTYNGERSYRIELRKDDPNVQGSKRSEIRHDRPVATASDHTYNFSVLLPNGGAEDYAIDPYGSEIIAQWHNTPDPGEAWTSPPLAIHTGAYNNKSDRYTLELNWDAGTMSTDNSLKRSYYDLGSFLPDKGQWVDWKVHVKWGWDASQSPIVQIYKNGTKIFEYAGPNATNDKVGTYMKLGVYKWDWAQTGTNNASILAKRVIYYGNVNMK